MLKPYRRHSPKCEHREEGREYRRCKCPIWAQGTLAGEPIRKAMKERSWDDAQLEILKWVKRGSSEEPKADTSEAMTIELACEKFMKDARGRELAEPTIYKYSVLFRRLRAFADDRGLRFLYELDLDQLSEFRDSWPDKNLTKLKNLERLRAFLRFCHDHEWIKTNPISGKKLKNPKVTDAPTLNFEREEVIAIFRACDRYPDRAHAVKLLAFVYVLRYTGLRIGDAVGLKVGPDTIDSKGNLFLRTAKTGTVVRMPLPNFVIDALRAIPLAPDAKYYFWSGKGKLKSAVGDWQRSLRRLFQLAGIEGGHAHRFRDTFAVELLLAGVPLERVSVLLGHQSVKVTQKHYNPWVSSRQEQLEADVRRAWERDSLAPEQTNGTILVQRESSKPN